MIKLIVAICSAIILVLLVGAYLAPDDLAKCGQKPSAQQGCESANVIVAISGGDTRARTNEAVRLYQQGWAPRLIFSGAAADKTGPSNASAMREQAIDAGVPGAAITLEEVSETTHQNAQLSSNVLANNDDRRVILVTSAYHQRRAGLEFSRYAGTGTQIVNHPVQRDNQWSEWWWLTPTGWWLAMSELVKIILVYVGVPR